MPEFNPVLVKELRGRMRGPRAFILLTVYLGILSGAMLMLYQASSGQYTDLNAGRPETNKLYRTVCRWWNEIEVLIVTGATTGKVEANNTGIKHIKRTARGYRNTGNYKSVILMRSAARMAA